MEDTNISIKQLILHRLKVAGHIATSAVWHLSGSPIILNAPSLFPSDPSDPEETFASTLLNTLYRLNMISGFEQKLRTVNGK
jgi:hypothetical protein